MNSHNSMQRTNQFGRLIRKYNPLGALRWILRHSHSLFTQITPLAKFIAAQEQRLTRYQQRLDYREFDKAHGTDTGQVIPIANMSIISPNSADGLWYEGVSPGIFKQFMTRLPVDPSSYVFLDYGSGKGRVLMMAAEHGYRKLVGVEFAREIHDIAIENARLFNRALPEPVDFEFHLMDAVDFQLPDSPLVIFFYCPFLGNVLDRVLDNIKLSHDRNPRPIWVLFYGQNPTAVAQFQSLGFTGSELKLKRDFTRFLHYRGIIFSSPSAVEDKVRT